MKSQAYIVKLKIFGCVNTIIDILINSIFILGSVRPVRKENMIITGSFIKKKNNMCINKVHVKDRYSVQGLSVFF